MTESGPLLVIFGESGKKGWGYHHSLILFIIIIIPYTPCDTFLANGAFQRFLTFFVSSSLVLTYTTLYLI